MKHLLPLIAVGILTVVCAFAALGLLTFLYLGWGLEPSANQGFIVTIGALLGCTVALTILTEGRS